ncbi:MAG: FAD-dependent oxidoreductase, partial [Desulfococcaceae bacterium]
KPSHFHKADAEGPAWRHKQGDGWLVLRGPSNEFWFDRWVAYLKQKGVRFFWEQPLIQLDYDGEKITRAHVASGDEVKADAFVLATNPFSAADILKKTPALARKDQLRLFGPLVQDGPHTQVSFRIAFSEKIVWPRKRAVFIIADSEFNLTICPVEEVWAPDVNLGAGVRSLWTGTACVATVPGRVYGLPIVSCTKTQFIEEVRTQLFACEALNAFIKKANGGRGLETFPILRIEAWHEWRFSPDGIQPRQPKWVTTTNTQRYQPTQATPVPNLVLAGAHTRTEADVWSIEGAVESGRRAAQVIEPDVRVLPQYRPWWLRWPGLADDVLFSFGGPHILMVILIAMIFILFLIMVE